MDWEPARYARERHGDKPYYLRTIAVVDDVLRKQDWANIREPDVILTGEGPEVCIVIIPHRQLGGIALVVWGSSLGFSLTWAWVVDLAHHDCLDMGTHLPGLDAPWDDVDARALVEHELHRPIMVAVRPRRVGKARADCSIEVDGVSKLIGSLRLSPSEFRGRGVSVTSLASDPLPFGVPMSEAIAAQ